ncbi:MAG: TlpA family protein disulfide reductase [Solirubrobacterales bacterium]
MKRLVVALTLLFLPAVVTAAELKPFGRGSWQELRQQHAGRPLVVHLWSLTCAPCLAELPEWGKVSPGAFDLVMLTTDSLEQESRIERALARAGLGSVERWAFDDPFVERLRFEIDRSWRGELPRTLLIGADGSVEVLSGAVGTAPVREWLKRQGGEHGSRH